MARAVSRKKARSKRKPAPAQRRMAVWRRVEVLLREHILLIGVCALYLLVAGTYSMLTPAWETNDEVDHTAYIQYVAVHGSAPEISVANGHESHQPPLYYFVAAGFQHLLGVNPFIPDPEPKPQPASPGLITGLIFAHDYTPMQQDHAIFVHEIRLLSVLFGLVTVVCTYAICLLVLSSMELALSAALFVTLLPKFDVVSGAITNDSLEIALSAVALFLVFFHFIRFQRGRDRLPWLAPLLGGVLGAAALTKFNGLPLISVAAAGILVTGYSSRTKAIDLAGLAVTFLAVTGWWFVHNYALYHSFLATDASNAYLRKMIRGLIAPVSWTDNRMLDWVPSRLVQNGFYEGGFNQFAAPALINLLLWAIAVICLAEATRKIVRERDWHLQGGLCLLAICCGLLAILLVAKDATQAESRLAYVALTAFALLMVVGLQEFLGRGKLAFKAAVFTWPLILALFNLYVFVRFVWPFRHL